MKNYSTAITSTPQTSPIPGRTDMVANSAGGYGFAITDNQLLDRFLLLGSEGGTYYVAERALTETNARSIILMIQSTGGLYVAQCAFDTIIFRKAPKVDAAIFVLALVATYGDAEAKAAIYHGIAAALQTGTHLFMFVANVNAMRGWSRGLRRAVAKWYTSRPAEKLAYQLAKYRSRVGFTHRDLLRLSHPVATTPEQARLLGYAVGKITGAESGSDLLAAFEKAQGEMGVAALASLIEASGLTWEMVPTEKLNEPKVLHALVKKMPVLALMRNLNRFAYTGLTTITSTNYSGAVVRSIIETLKTSDKSGIHPVTILNALRTYSNGKGVKGDKTWMANPEIVAALDDAFYQAIEASVPTGKRILVGVDISGSMSHEVGGTVLSARELAAVLSMVAVRREATADLVWFDDSIRIPTTTKRDSLTTILSKTPRGGATDCSLPIKLALDTKIAYDAIIILTDNETWAGKRHGTEILDSYRKTISPNVKVIEVAMTATPNSTLPEDGRLLRVVGFDSSVADVIANFIKG